MKMLNNGLEKAADKLIYTFRRLKNEFLVYVGVNIGTDLMTFDL